MQESHRIYYFEHEKAHCFNLICKDIWTKRTNARTEEAEYTLLTNNIHSLLSYGPFSYDSLHSNRKHAVLKLNLKFNEMIDKRNQTSKIDQKMYKILLSLKNPGTLEKEVMQAVALAKEEQLKL